MRSRPGKLARSHGVAMVIVLWVIMVLSLLISGFAFRMHVETQVAGFGRKERKAEMLARSGIEVARMTLIQDQKSAGSTGIDALNQAWATNQELFVDHELGEGKFNVTVTDEERKLPLNKVSPEQLHKLMDLLGVDPLDADVIVDSMLDWVDEDDLHHLNGAENEYYSSLQPPYRVKNAPFDRVEELLLVRGVTKELFEGTGEEGRPGLKDVLTTTSQGQVNINTASDKVLQAAFDLDDQQMALVLSRRDGPDGIAGTEDDQPFRSPSEFFATVGLTNPTANRRLAQIAGTRSQFFRVKSTGTVGGVSYTIDVVMRRQTGKCLVVSWTEKRGA